MTWFLSYLGSQSAGILVLLLVLAAAGGLLNWILWMFGKGRFHGSPTLHSKIRYVLTDFFVEIIDDFRNLLALIVVALFAVALFMAMWPGIRAGKTQDIKDGVQSVAAALGGLIGSIIGYYFGESAGKAKAARMKAAEDPAISVPPVAGTGDPEMIVPEKPKIE